MSEQSYVFFSHRMMCSYGSRMLLSVRNGYVMISSFALSTTRGRTLCLLLLIILSSGFHSPGHQRPDQQGLLSLACHTPRQTRYKRLRFSICGNSHYSRYHCCNPNFKDWQNKCMPRQNGHMMSPTNTNELWLCSPPSLALWIMAAKSELEDRSSSESARHLFLRALRFHPNNKKVYQEVKESMSWNLYRKTLFLLERNSVEKRAW